MDKNVNEYSFAQLTGVEVAPVGEIAIPEYLQRVYWWTYIHPLAVKVFDHLWVVNLILLTNYNRMRDTALQEIGNATSGKVLQISCAYGDLTPKLAKRVAAGGGSLDVIDVLPIQLKNTKRKLPLGAPVRLVHRDSTNLCLPSQSYDWVMVFFLLHEQPADVRLRTLREAFRVVKPHGKVMILDFSKPRWWNPFRYLWAVFLWIFEPFALGVWWNDITTMLPSNWKTASLKRESFFGGLFQKVVVSR